MNSLRTFPVLLVLVLAISSAASAETLTLVCDYKTIADNEDGLQPVKKPFVLTFLMDRETEKAYMIGNNGSVEVELVVNAGDGLTFIETTVSGNVMTTTIIETGESVHSRNSILLGELIPSQYYGTCEEK